MEKMKKLCKPLIIILLAFVISILGIGVMPQLITIGALCAGSIYFIMKKVDEPMRTKMAILFLVAFLLQILMSLFMYNQTVDTKYYGFSYKGDDYIYGDFGTIVGDLWRKGVFWDLNKLKYYNLIGEAANIQGYQLYCALIFYLFGAVGGQILLIANCFFHAIIIIPVYFICRDLNIRDKIIMFTFVLFLFWPSTFHWSVFNFKDPIILLSIFAVFGLLIQLREKICFKNVLLLLFFLFIIYWVREYLIVVSIVSFYYFFTFWKWKHKNIALLIILISLIIMQLVKHPVIKELPNIPSTSWAIRNANVNIESNTPYLTGLFTYTYPTTLLYLPFGLSAALALPFLLRPLALSHIVANIESIFWWCMIPFLINGIWISMRTELKKIFPILFIFLYWLLVIALTQGNMGTLIRQKSIVYYIGFIFIGLAVDKVLKGIRISGDQDTRCET